MILKFDFSVWKVSFITIGIFAFSSFTSAGEIIIDPKVWEKNYHLKSKTGVFSRCKLNKNSVLKNRFDRWTTFKTYYPSLSSPIKHYEYVWVDVLSGGCALGTGYVLKNIISDDRLAEIDKPMRDAYKLAQKQNTVKAYHDFIVHFRNRTRVKDAMAKIYHLTLEQNKITGYEWFLENYPDSERAPDAIKKIYQLIQDENNIAGYQWFLEAYPDAKISREALKNLHKRAFELADDIGTIASYNDFVIAYPFAAQVEQANQEAYALEEDEYSSFFTSDAKLSRALLVRSKQMERKARDGSRAQRPGYMLVVNRMNELLQEQFPAEEATLRYLESEEFKSFYRDFKRVLNRIDRKLADIRSHTSNLSSLINEQTRLMDNHFAKAAESREMSAELTKQHRFWERYLAKNE